MANNSVKTLWCGSTNVTDNCMVFNNNNALIIRNDSMYDKYKQYFDHLLGGGTGANVNIAGVYTAALSDINLEYMFSYKSSGRSSPNLPLDKILSKVNAAVHDIYFMGVVTKTVI